MLFFFLITLIFLFCCFSLLITSFLISSCVTIWSFSLFFSFWNSSSFWIFSFSWDICCLFISLFSFWLITSLLFSLFCHCSWLISCCSICSNFCSTFSFFFSSSSSPCSIFIFWATFLLWLWFIWFFCAEPGLFSFSDKY